VDLCEDLPYLAHGRFLHGAGDRLEDRTLL
jgi:hypothetical protein